MTPRELSAFYELTYDLAHLTIMRENLRKSIVLCEKPLEAFPDIVAAMTHDLKKLDERINDLTTVRRNKAVSVISFVNSVAQRTVQAYMRLHFIHGLTWDEIAYLTDTTSGDAVKQRVHTHILKTSRAKHQRAGDSQSILELLRVFREQSSLLSELEDLSQTIHVRAHGQIAIDILSRRPFCDIPEELQRLREEILQLRYSLKARAPNVNGFIDLADDAEAREYMRLFFIQGLSWEDVAKTAYAHSGEAASARVWRCTRGINMPLWHGNRETHDSQKGGETNDSRNHDRAD